MFLTDSLSLSLTKKKKFLSFKLKKPKNKLKTLIEKPFKYKNVGYTETLVQFNKWNTEQILLRLILTGRNKT